jgi:predicted RNA-binding protein with TRAM domain
MYDQDRGGFGNPVPVKEGDELTVAIEAVGAKGDGIAKKDGFVLFVPNTKEGQNVKIRVTRVLRKVGFAEVVGEGKAEEQAQEASDEGSDSGEAAENTPSEEGQEPNQDSAPENPEDSEDFGEDSENK